jgi:hypothetical protein
MTKSEAMLILDEVKNGFHYPIERINRALIVTGDLRNDRTALCNDGFESCYVRARQIYGEKAYERTFGIVQERGSRRETED